MPKSSPRRMITALRYHGQKDIRLERVPSRPCGVDEVRLQIAYCGICGSDIHEYLGGPIFAPKPGKKNPWTGEQLPITMGHEFSGVIIELGANVDNLQIGSRVAVNPAFDDRHYGLEPCNTCVMGKRNICQRYASYGLSAPGGGFASEIVVKAICCIVLPEAVSLQVGALLEPLAVAWHSLRTANFRRGQSALVLGAGPIGLAIVMLLRVWGARTVVVSEVMPSRRRLAKDFGADIIINPMIPMAQPVQEAYSVLSTIHEKVSLNGVDVAFEATGLQVTLEIAVASIRPGGTVFNVAIHEKPLRLNLNDIACLEKRLTGGMCYTMEDFTGVIGALESGSLPAHRMITSIVPLSQAVDGGFSELIRSKDSHVKILVQPAVSLGSEPRRTSHL